MGFHLISDEIEDGAVQLVHPTGRVSIGTSMATATTPDGSCRTNKKRKRNEQLTPITSPTATATFVEISDDSDASSDEEKSPQESSQLRGALKHRQLGLATTKKRRNHHKGRRSVRFGDTTSTTQYYATDLTKAELKDLKKDLWFTKQDRLRSQAECLETLKVFRIQNAEEVAEFSAVYKTSMQVPYSKESSDFLERATVSVPLTIRGMEWGIAPKLKKRRREHIQNVLSLQEQISDVQLRERFVSSRSLQSSRPAKIMARMIGEGDAAMPGTISTALNVTTTPMTKAKTKKKAATEKPSLGATMPLREQQGNTTESSNATIKPSGTSCGATTKRTKLGHARRRRRPVLWRK